MITPEQWDILKKHPGYLGEDTDLFWQAEDAADIPDYVREFVTDDACRILDDLPAFMKAKVTYMDCVRRCYAQMAPQEDVALQLEVPLAA